MTGCVVIGTKKKFNIIFYCLLKNIHHITQKKRLFGYWYPMVYCYVRNHFQQQKGTDNNLKKKQKLQ